MYLTKFSQNDNLCLDHIYLILIFLSQFYSWNILQQARFELGLLELKATVLTTWLLLLWPAPSSLFLRLSILKISGLWWHRGRLHHIARMEPVHLQLSQVRGSARTSSKLRQGNRKSARSPHLVDRSGPGPWRRHSKKATRRLKSFGSMYQDFNIEC